VHFDHDMTRIDALLAHADGLPAGLLPEDIYRHAVAASVGALDAYLCVAYVHLLVATIRAFRSGGLTQLPQSLQKELLPIGPLLARRYPSRENWALRMAARSRMERENMIQITKVKDTFNPFLPSGQKLWDDVIRTYMALGRKRLTGWVAADLAGKSSNVQTKRRKQAVHALTGRLGQIVQRRNDIVHNCDRPKQAIQGLTKGQAHSMVRDVNAFTDILDRHFVAHRTA
jgi:hypothetical protein